MNAGIEILTSAASTRLSTAQTVRDALCLDATLADAVIEALIDRASAAIARRVNVASAPGATLGRERVRERFASVAPFEPLFLSRRPIAALVRIAEDAAETLAGFSGFALNRVNGRLAKMGGRVAAPWTADEIVVEYDAGWLLPGQSGRDLPADLEAACIQWVDAMLAVDRESERPRIAKESLAGVGSWEYELVKRHGEDGCPPGVAGLLRPYIRRHV
ncbi:MAG: hypothetical protein K2Q06_06120 [Parvularculaceae bacterium]|nr:hypothetical protein [Parvularculaceae bacterium]